MSRPRYYGFGFLQKLIRRYPDKLKQSKSLQAAIAVAAIERAIEETKAKPNGDERIRLIELLYWQKNLQYTLEGAAMQLYISERTAQKWNSDFIYCVARHGGYV